MNHPSATQLRTAIKVVKKLSRRIQNQTNHSVEQSPGTQSGEDYVAKMRAQGVEQNVHITILITELEAWCQEVQQQRRQSVIDQY